MNESLKFVWAYMIEQGRVTNGEWSYYSGNFEDAYQNNHDYTARATIMNSVRLKVKEIGIDWNKTKSPTSSMESSFEGTFSPSSYVETLLGVLVLKDGTEYTIGVGNAEKRFLGYLEILNNLMEDKERVKDILGE